MRAIPLVAAVLLSFGCERRHERKLGHAFEGEIISIATAKQLHPDSSAVVHGRLTEKCPVAGCWFVLHDSAGTIRVDTKSAGFVVVDIPLQTLVTVAGKIATNETERIVEATGLRY